MHTRSSLRNYLHPLHSALFSTHSAEKLRLKLSEPPTEKEEDHTFGLNYWTLFVHKMTHDSELECMFEIYRPEPPKPPQELKQYAEMVLDSKKEIVEETINAIAQLFTNPISKLILENALFPCLLFDDPKLLRSDEMVPSFPNLSAGEIAIFDLILDIVIKKVIDDETVICIDEPELHIHTKLQGQLLEELYNLISPKSQLWIATHSIGMVRKAQDLWREDPDSVVFLDFGKDNSGQDRDFDGEVAIKPDKPNPNFWAQAYDVALGDLAELVITEWTVFCEGENFDADCYKNIFGSRYPETRFISLGGWENVEKSLKALNRVIGKIAKNAKVIGLIDGDDANPLEIGENNKKGIHTFNTFAKKS